MILRIIHHSSCFSSIKMKMTVIIFAVSSCSTLKIHANIATNGKITHLAECCLRDCIHNFFRFTQINPVMIPDGWSSICCILPFCREICRHASDYFVRFFHFPYLELIKMVDKYCCIWHWDWITENIKLRKNLSPWEATNPKDLILANVIIPTCPQQGDWLHKSHFQILVAEQGVSAKQFFFLLWHQLVVLWFSAAW